MPCALLDGSDADARMFFQRDQQLGTIVQLISVANCDNDDAIRKF